MQNIVVTEEIKQKIKELAEKGLMDSEISKELGIKDGTVFYWRKKMGIKSQFTYDRISKINNKKFEELFYQGYSDYYIAKQLNMSPDGIYSHRMRHKYIRKENLRFNKSIKLSQYQKEVLIGTMLGDSTLRLGKGCVSPSMSCAHGIKQKEYSEHKAEIFKSLGAVCNYHKRNIADKRNNIYYEDYTMFIPANPEFLPYYNAFYPNGKKVIPIELLKEFSAISLAFMFMDDGSKDKSSYNIATNCFTLEELEKFKAFLYMKFGIEVVIYKNHVIRIKHSSKRLFELTISPYIIPSMKYKLHSVS